MPGFSGEGGARPIDARAKTLTLATTLAPPHPPNPPWGMGMSFTTPVPAPPRLRIRNVRVAPSDTDRTGKFAARWRSSSECLPGGQAQGGRGGGPDEVRSGCACAFAGSRCGADVGPGVPCVRAGACVQHRLCAASRPHTGPKPSHVPTYVVVAVVVPVDQHAVESPPVLRARVRRRGRQRDCPLGCKCM